MKVKAGDKIFDGDKERIMVILTDTDKKNIRNMHPDCTKYCVYPESKENTQENIFEWMDKE